MDYEQVKQHVRRSSVGRLLAARRIERHHRKWIAAGSPIPPPHPIKARRLLHLADAYGLDVLVETGTGAGAMVEATRHRFRKVVSIELNPAAVARARRRFVQDRHVTIVEGDSGVVLGHVLAGIGSPALFWLDGHYSGPGTAHGTEATPISRELTWLSRRPRGDVIVIDDARLFGADPGYPDLHAFVDAVRTDFASEPEIEGDAIVIRPGSSDT